MTYMNYAQFGVLNAYNRDYPQALGRRDMAEANKLKNTAMTFMVIVYTIIITTNDSVTSSTFEKYTHHT